MQQEEYSFGDKLLFVLSAKRKVSWATFKSVFDSLLTNDMLSQGDKPIAYDRYQALRILDSLGHCDFHFSRDEDAVCIAPPIVVRLPLAGLPRAVLTGGQVPLTHEQLENAALDFESIVVTKSQQKYRHKFSPSRTLIHAESKEELQMFSELIEIPYLDIPPSWNLINFCGDLDQYRSTLNWEEKDDLNWPRIDFDPEKLRFQNKLIQNGLRLSSYGDPKRNGKRLHLIWDGNKCAEIDRDWGRYLVLASLGTKILFYDKYRHTLGIPANVPLPRLFMRALALCVGLAPIGIQEHALMEQDTNLDELHLYHAIPIQIAEMLASKLQQTLQYCDFDVGLEGKII